MKTIVIKKYPNRRLYDTENSKYIKITDLKKMIIDGANIQVLDSNTDEDITRTVLMQIITEAETAGKPIFNAVMLQQIIRFYGGDMQGMFAQFLQDSLDMFTRQQSGFEDLMSSSPISTMTKMAEKNLQMWSEMQKNFFGMNTDKSNKNKD